MRLLCLSGHFPFWFSFCFYHFAAGRTPHHQQHLAYGPPSVSAAGIFYCDHPILSGGEHTDKIRDQILHFKKNLLRHYIIIVISKK